MTPKSASAMPTLQRIKYFHAASIELFLSSTFTKNDDASVVPSIAIHITPRLLESTVRSMVKRKR